MIIIFIIIFLTISIETMKILHMNILIVIAKATLMKMMATNRSIDERTVRKFEKPNYKF